MDTEMMLQTLSKMTSFILLDGREKAHEIDVASWDQANIRKVNILQLGLQEIDRIYDKFEDQVVFADKKHMSMCLLQARIKLEECRYELLESVLEEAKSELAERLQTDSDFYETMFSATLIQALFTVLSNQPMLVFVQKQDFELAKKLIPSALEVYKSKSGYRRMKIKVRRDFYLTTDVDVKVAVTTKKQKINCRISLMERLNLVFQEMTPSIKSFLKLK